MLPRLPHPTECVKDACGVCDGDGSSCADCAGTPNGNAVEDDCGVCGGDGSSCAPQERTDPYEDEVESSYCMPGAHYEDEFIRCKLKVEGTCNEWDSRWGWTVAQGGFYRAQNIENEEECADLVSERCQNPIEAGQIGTNQETGVPCEQCQAKTKTAENCEMAFFYRAASKDCYYGMSQDECGGTKYGASYCAYYCEYKFE